MDGKKEPPVYQRWTREDEAKLVELRKKEIDIADTAFGRHVATKKRELTAAVDQMDKDERAALKRKLEELDEALDEEEASEPATAPEPTNITAV